MGRKVEVDFTDFAILVNSKSFVSVPALQKKIRLLTTEALRKRLKRLCAKGLMEICRCEKTYFRTTKKGCKQVLSFYEEQNLRDLFDFLRSF